MHVRRIYNRHQSSQWNPCYFKDRLPATLQDSLNQNIFYFQLVFSLLFFINCQEIFIIFHYIPKRNCEENKTHETLNSSTLGNTSSNAMIKVSNVLVRYSIPSLLATRKEKSMIHALLKCVFRMSRAGPWDDEWQIAATGLLDQALIVRIAYQSQRDVASRYRIAALTASSDLHHDSLENLTTTESIAEHRFSDRFQWRTVPGTTWTVVIRHHRIELF